MFALGSPSYKLSAFVDLHLKMLFLISVSLVESLRLVSSLTTFVVIKADLGHEANPVSLIMWQYMGFGFSTVFWMCVLGVGCFLLYSIAKRPHTGYLPLLVAFGLIMVASTTCFDAANDVSVLFFHHSFF